MTHSIQTISRTTAALSLTLMALVAFNPLASTMPSDDETGKLNSYSPVIHLQNHQGLEQSELQQLTMFLTNLSQSAANLKLFTSDNQLTTNSLRKLLPTLPDSDLFKHSIKLIQLCYSASGQESDPKMEDAQVNIASLNKLLSNLMVKNKLFNPNTFSEEEHLLLIMALESALSNRRNLPISVDVGKLGDLIRTPNQKMSDIIEKFLNPES